MPFKKEQMFVIADYRALESLILQLKAAGLTNLYYERQKYHHLNQTFTTQLNLEGTKLHVTHAKRVDDKQTVFEQTLYLGELALCKTEAKCGDHWEPDWLMGNHSQLSSTLLYQGPLPTRDLLTAPVIQPKALLFFIGKQKPSELDLKHLSYAGLTEKDLIKKEDECWYFQIPHVNSFEVQQENRPGLTIDLLFFRGKLIAYSLSPSTHFEIHHFPLSDALGSIDIFLEEAYRAYHSYAGLTFEGTIEALERELANNAIYNRICLTTLFDSTRYAYQTLTTEKLQTLCKAIEKNPHLNALEIHDLHSRSNPTVRFNTETFLLLLTTLRTLPNFKEIHLQGVTLEIPNDPDVMQQIEKLTRGISFFILSANTENKALLLMLGKCKPSLAPHSVLFSGRDVTSGQARSVNHARAVNEVVEKAGGWSLS